MSSLWWFVGAMVLGIAELFTLDLTFAMLAGGALAAGGVAMMGAPLWLSIFTFAAVSSLLFFVLRPVLMRRFRTEVPATATNSARLVGRSGRAIDDVTTTSGRIKFNGEVWTARTRQGTIPEDANARVIAIEGATAIVAPEEE